MDCVSKCGCRLEGGRRRQVVRKHRESELREDMVEDDKMQWMLGCSGLHGVDDGWIGSGRNGTTDGSCESECGLRRGARGTGEIRRSVMAGSLPPWQGRSKHGPEV